MHDCRQVERRLLDLVFDKVSEDEQTRLLAEIESCSECLGQYSSLRGTIRVFDRAVEATLPEESFWPQHHEALRRHLANNAHQVTAHPIPFWKRFLEMKLHVPVPVAAVFLIALLTLSVLALRFSPTSPAPTVAQQPALTLQPPPSVVEVPIVQEKVVIRTVFVEKTKREMRGEGLASATSERSAPLARDKENNQEKLLTRASLTDFQPPDELRIRIIKRSKSDEK